MIRQVIDKSRDLYDLDLSTIVPITGKSYKGKISNGKEYFIKKTDNYMQEKFKFLYDQGIDNILFPIRNRTGDFITKDEESYYITDYINDFYMLNEIKAVNLVNQLDKLHKNTFFKRQLTPSSAKTKMDEIFLYLQYKYNTLEMYIRSLEERPFDEFSIPILKSYYIILDSKKTMADIQRRLISAIKEKKSVYFSYIHNNPKIDHLLISGGYQYLISIEHSKLGIPSLDIVKFYIENECCNVDMKSIITSYFSKFDDSFYYDYFCFMVILYYLKGITIIDKDYITTQSFVYATESIKKFMDNYIQKETPPTDR